MQNNGNQNNQKSSNSNNLQSSSVNQNSSSNIGPRIMQNPSVSLIVDNSLTDGVGVAVVDLNISNQRTNQISRTNTLPVYAVKLLAGAALTSLGALVSMAAGFAACEASRNKVECREISSALASGAGFIIWSAFAVTTLIKHANQANVRVHNATDAPPVFDISNPSRPDNHVVSPLSPRSAPRGDEDIDGLGRF